MSSCIVSTKSNVVDWVASACIVCLGKQSRLRESSTSWSADTVCFFRSEAEVNELLERFLYGRGVPNLVSAQGIPVQTPGSRLKLFLASHFGHQCSRRLHQEIPLPTARAANPDHILARVRQIGQYGRSSSRSHACSASGDYRFASTEQRYVGIFGHTFAKV